MPFECHLAVYYDGNIPLSPERLAMSHVIVTSNANLINTEFDKDDLLKFDENGVIKLRYMVPKNVHAFQLIAEFNDGEVMARTRLSAVKIDSMRERYLQITSSTQLGEAGNYGIFQVRSNFYMNFFTYLVISKGKVTAWELS